MQPAKLILKDDSVFEGFSPSWQSGNFIGEVVFNTGMTGYDQSLTDPSYKGQILAFTYPLIGNYGVMDKEKWESTKIHAAGVIVSEACINWSHAASLNSLLEWLMMQEVPIITDIDTRALTKHLRSHGTMMGMITKKSSNILKNFIPKPQHVTIDKPIIYNPDQTKKIILVDCGLKHNILRSIIELPLLVKRVPMDYDYTKEDYDGVIISNGPGDPTDYPQTIKITKKALAKNKPVFGICLGSQIMALAAGAKTYKLTFGHRGHNQPCISSSGERCYITSQNHSYAIDEKTLPKGWEVNFRNLNDNSVEGVQHKTKPFFSVQFHPEANPGPTDTQWLFERFYKLL